MNPRNGQRREERFRRIRAAEGIPLMRPTRTFRFKRCWYRPDFYSPTEGVYYEVLGSRQREYQIYPKIDLMDLCYPEIILRLVDPAGKPVHLGLARRALRWQVPWAQELQAALEEHRMTLRDLAARLGYAPSSIKNALMLQQQAPLGRIRSWLDKEAKSR